MRAANKPTALIVRPRSPWRRHLVISMAVFALTVTMVSFISQNSWQKSNPVTGSKAIAIVEHRTAEDRAVFPNGPIFSSSSNLKNLKTRMLSPSFIRQALCDSRIDLSQTPKNGARNASIISPEQLLRGLNISDKPGAVSDENQIILELTLTQSPNAAKIARALADRFVREYRTFWAAEVQKAYLAASSQADQAQQAHYMAVELLQAFEDNVLKQEIPAPEQPTQIQTDQQPAPQIADNPAWIELDRKLASLRQQEAALLANKTPLHPDVQDVQARIVDFQRQIDSVPRFASEPPTNNPLRQMDSSALVTTSPLKEHQDSNTPENIAAGINQTETVETLKQLLSAAEHTEQEYLQKLHSKQILFETSRNAPNFFIRVDPVAIPNTQPGSDRGFIGLMLFSGFAMALGMGVFSSGVSTQPVLASIADLEPLLPVPIIGVVAAKDQSSNPLARRRRRAILRWTLILLGGLIVLGCSIGVYWYFALLK